MSQWIKIVLIFSAFLFGKNNKLFCQCDFQPGNPSGGTETVCFYDEFDNLLGCSYNCQVTGQQIKCGYKAGDEPWPNYFKVTFTSLTCFSPFVASPLPVKLSSYSIKRTNKGIQIDWTTVTERNSAYFELQKSLDGYSFETIAIIVGAGNSEKENNYQFIDNDIRSNMSYYRIKQVDFDGEFQYFQTLAMEYIPTGNLEIVNYDENYFKLLSRNIIKEVTVISIDGKQQNIKVESENLIKKSDLIGEFSILHLTYIDETSDFKRMAIVNY